MDMYKELVFGKVRFETERGILSAEQLVDLPVAELDRLAVKLQQEYKTSGKKSFLVQKSRKDKLAKLKFDIVLDILTTKIEASESAKLQREAKAHNEKIMSIIAEKEDDSLKSKSVDELKTLLK